MDFFLVILKLQGGPKSDEIFAYFQTPPANFLLSRPNAAEYCNYEKNLLSTDGCTTMCVTFRKLRRTTPEIHAALFLKTNRLGHVLFPFARWQHCWYAQTALCIRRTLCRHVTIGTPMVLSVFDDWYSVPFVENSQKTVKTAKMTISVPIVTGIPGLYQQCTNGVPIVKNSQKQSKHSQNSTKMTIDVPVVTRLPRLYQPYTNSVPKQSKDSQNSKNDHWCTNRHRSTKIVPTV